MSSNEKYKAVADRSRRATTFEVGDDAMVHLRRGRFLIETYSKLKSSNFSTCQFLKKVNDDTCAIDLSEEFNMFETFNVADLRKYYP